MVKHFGYFRYQPFQLFASPHGQKIVMTSLQCSLGWNFLQVLIFCSLGKSIFMYLLHVSFIFTSFFSFFFFGFSVFSNLRGSNPTAISKMSIIVSLKKLQSEHGMTHIMEELIIHCNKSIKFYDKPLSGELNIILSRSHTDYKAYICNGNLNLLHRLQFLSVCMSLDLIN